MSTRQHPTIATVSLDGVALLAGTTAFCQLCRQESPLCAQPTWMYPLGQSPGRGAPCRHTMVPSGDPAPGGVAGACRSAREPGWSSGLLSMFRGNVNSGDHQFFQSWVVLSAPRELSWFPTFSMRSLSLAYCAKAVQLTHSCLSGKTALYTGVYLMCSWKGASSSSTSAATLDLPL